MLHLICDCVPNPHRATNGEFGERTVRRHELSVRVGQILWDGVLVVGTAGVKVQDEIEVGANRQAKALR